MCVCFKCLCFISASEQLFIAETCKRLFVHRRWRFLYKRTYLLNYSMQKSPSWEANRFSVNQEIPRILWNPNVHYRHHKCPLTVATLSQIDPVNTPTCHFFKIHLNIFLPSTPWSPKCALSSGFPTKTLSTPLLSPICAICPAHLILLDYWLSNTDHYNLH